MEVAIRETEEEIDLPASYAQVLGNMPDYPTTTGFIALIRPGFVLAPDTSEVADIFEVPLAFLMDPANHRLYEARLPDGHVRRLLRHAMETALHMGSYRRHVAEFVSCPGRHSRLLRRFNLLLVAAC